MDDIETMMFNYVQLGRVFAGNWKAMNLAAEIEVLPDGMDAYLRRLEARRALPEEGEDIACALTGQLRTVQKSMLAAKDAADPTSGERFALDTKLNKLSDLRRMWNELAAVRGAILDRRAARELANLLAL